MPVIESTNGQAAVPPAIGLLYHVSRACYSHQCHPRGYRGVVYGVGVCQIQPCYAPCGSHRVRGLAHCVIAFSPPPPHCGVQRGLWLAGQSAAVPARRLECWLALHLCSLFPAGADSTRCRGLRLVDGDELNVVLSCRCNISAAAKSHLAKTEGRI